MFDKYVIQEGDSIARIADKFNTTKENLLDINNLLVGDRLSIGQEIIVPSNNNYYDIYAINKGDTLYSIAKIYNINPTLLAALNGLNQDDYIYPDQEILIPKSGYSYYITAEGDTLDLVADKFNCNKNDMLVNNNIYLLPGQLLVHKK